METKCLMLLSLSSKRCSWIQNLGHMACFDLNLSPPYLQFGSKFLRTTGRVSMPIAIHTRKMFHRHPKCYKTPKKRKKKYRYYIIYDVIRRKR